MAEGVIQKTVKQLLRDRTTAKSSFTRKANSPIKGADTKMQLLDSVDSIISKDLRLTTYNTAEEIFRVMENRYGNKSTIAIEILEELEKIPPVKGNQPRKVIDLIQTVEKALADLTDLGNSGAIKNPLVIKSIESKLPDFIKRDWLFFFVNPSNNVTSDNHHGQKKSEVQRAKHE